MRAQTRGLSLVEMTALIGLISLIVIFTFPLVANLKLSNRRANAEISASSIAQSELQARISGGYDKLSAPPTDEIVERDGITFTRTVDVNPGAEPETRLVRVTVAWTWQEKQHSVFRETLLTRVPRS